ncbi:MAG TPA: glycosyltransferase family 4 protein, partial [Candidatus Limnocylindrales bacterium]
DEKAQLFRTADVYVSPATGRESFGIVLLEAMAAGTPIVCSDIHGYKGVVRRGEQAILVPPRSPKALAAGIRELLADPALRERMALAGRVRAEEYSWERVTAKVDEYYGFVIRRLASQGALPPDFRAEVPAPARTALPVLEPEAVARDLEPGEVEPGDAAEAAASASLTG